MEALSRSDKTDLLVVGASGQDGKIMLRIAGQAGIKVVGTSRAGADGLVSLDTGNSDAIDQLLDRMRPRRIVLLAAQSSVGASFKDPVGTWSANTRPVLAVCDWIRRRSPDTTLVFVASGECFGRRYRDDPACEDDPFRPSTPYGASKAAAASLVRGFREAFNLPLSIAYPFNHESSERDERFVFGKVLAGLRRLRNGSDERIVLGDLSVVRDWGYAPDYVAAMLAMTEMPEPQDLILATGRSVSLRAAVEALVEEAGFSFCDVVQAGEVALSHHQVGDEQHADASRAKIAIGWSGSTPFPELAGLLMGPSM